MMIISFAHTTPALLAGRKNVTRREWSDDYARRVAAGVPGLLVAAWDKSPRVVNRKTGKPVGHRVTKEPMADMPDSDYEGEGFAYLFEHPESLPKTLWGEPVSHEDFAPDRFDHWRHSGGEMWVVRFETVEVCG